MKTRIILISLCAWLFAGTLYGQVRGTVPFSKSERTQELLVEKNTSKQYILEISQQIMDLLEKEAYDQAESLFEQGLNGCEDLKDKVTCRAGMYFTGGYVFQQAAKKGGERTGEYVEKANKYYSSVLEVYPENRGALGNLIKLKEDHFGNAEAISFLEQRVALYPKEKLKNLVEIGDLYLEDNNYGAACSYFKIAYDEDPFSELACNRLVDLYTVYDIECNNYKNIKSFAYDCNEVGFPNYAEDLLSHELLLNVQKRKKFGSKNNRKSRAADKEIYQSILAWVDMLAKNNWLIPERIERVRKSIFKDKIKGIAGLVRGNDILQDLTNILDAGRPESIPFSGFWNNQKELVTINYKDISLSPRSVFIKVLISKGKEAYFKSDYQGAESWWNAARKQAYRFDNTLYIQVARNLARLYNNFPKLDTGGNEMDALIEELFDEKGQAYLTNNHSVIRDCHITLGVIYYDRKKWRGAWAQNAEFQLRKALSPDFGPIVNPDLRKMLGDTYIAREEYDKAVGSYKKLVEDYLKLDQMTYASREIKKISKNEKLNSLSGTTALLKDLRVVTDWRLACKDPKSGNQDLNNIEMKEFLSASISVENNPFVTLDRDFVNVQLFKGWSDIAENVPDEKSSYKQLLYSTALNKIRNMNTLETEADYRRVKNIQTSLVQNVDKPGQWVNTKLNRNVAVAYDNKNTVEKYKTYLLSAMDQVIQLPEYMFEINDLIQKYYMEENKTDLPKIAKAETTYRIIEKG